MYNIFTRLVENVQMGIYIKGEVFMNGIRKITALLLCMVFAVCGMCYTGAAPAVEYTVEGSFVTQSTNTGESAKKATVTFVEKNGVRYSAEVSENGNIGTYSVRVEPGVYDITIEKPGYLTYTVSGVRVSNRDIFIPELAILPGDLDGDGRISTKDLAVFMRGFSTKPEYAALRELADFDENGILNVTDLGAIKPNYDKSNENYEWTNIMKLQTDYRYNPLGIDYKEPEFNWVMESTKRGEKQTAYRIGVATTYNKAVNGEFDIWDSGKITTDETHAYYGRTIGEGGVEAAELLPKTEYFWTVSSWNADGKEIPSAEIASFETALFGNFGADNKWIEAGEMYYKSEGTVEVTLTPTASKFGVNIFVGEDGSRYMWQFELRDEGVHINPHYADANGWKITSTYTSGISKDISSIITEGAAAIGKQIKLSVYFGDNGKLQTYVNDKFAFEYDAQGTNRYMGRVYAHASGGETGNIDNVRFIDTDGNVILEGVSDTTLAAPLFRKQFTLSQSLSNVAKARLYSTAAGNQIMYMNGQRASDDYMAPGKSKYTEVLYYQTYDVTDKLLDGDNTIGAEVGHGWYNAGAVATNYGTNVALKAKLIITYNDGSEQIIDTDSTWLGTKNGRTTTDKYYIGQYVDARNIIDGWCENDNESLKWAAVKATDTFKSDSGYTMASRFVAENMEPVRNTEIWHPTSVTNPEENTYIYKFDQNIVGTSRITAKAPAGTEIVIKYCEFLTGGKITGTEYLSHNGTDRYIFRGDENGETVEFDLVYHGFQYLQIEGLSEPLDFECVEGLVLTSDMDRTGYLETSNDKLNRYIENVLWSIKGNFVSTLTDCPTREKNTWTGDAQIFAAVASYYSNVYNHYRNFQDMTRHTQFLDGAIPELIPDMSSNKSPDGNATKTPSGWSDCIIVIPWEMYNQYGDITIIKDNYDAMKKWIDFVLTKKIYADDNGTVVDKEAPSYIVDGKYVRIDGNYGDHLAHYNNMTGVGYKDMEYKANTVVWRETSYAEVGTAFTAYSCMILAEMAEEIGETEDAAYYRELHGKFAKAWRTNFVKEDGITCKSAGTSDADGNYTDGEGSQTSYAFGLFFDLYENEEKKRAAAEKLSERIAEEGYIQTVGFLGMNIIYPALGSNGQFDTAMRMMENESYPSLLNMVNNGATSIWETYGGGTMSRNHYVFGAPARWLYTDILGISHQYVSGNEGFRHFELRPHYASYEDTSVTWAKGSYDSISGLIESEWKLSEDRSTFTYKCTVPANTSATLSLPVENINAYITEGGIDINDAEGIEYIKTEDGRKYYEITSGVYEFVVHNDIDAK